VSVTPEGREHPKQLCVHLPESVAELKKIVNVIHAEKRLACLHLNHAGAAANPMVTGTAPKASSAVTCSTSGKTSEPLRGEEIDTIIAGYASAARKATEAGFDQLEIQAGHGYLISQFLNRKINKRPDRFGQDRLAFAKAVFPAVKKGAPNLPFMVRISGNEMSPEFGIDREDLLPFIQLAEQSGAVAIHGGMGSSCFSPPWCFHHSSLPEKPQMDALAWIREQTNLPLIVAGRMGRINRIETIHQKNLADGVKVEQDGEKKSLVPFQTVILASGMRTAPGPGEDIQKAVPKLEIIGDANEVQDIFSAVHAGYEMAQRY
jgi:2,4-dienoyl-CoA reductase-like NADH-dependent reductase (Old Yellow Enzyme family)